jgi:RNA polymerase sigma-32 factor
MAKGKPRQRKPKEDDQVEVEADVVEVDEEAELESEAGNAEIIDVDEDGVVADAVIDNLVTSSGKEKVSGSIAKHDPLTAYMQETRRYRLLSREEEHELAVRFVENDDTNAARKLIESNLRLVVKIAYEYRRAHRNLLDLIQEGNIGLMQAVKKYDPYRGVKLSSYAAWWIRAYILKFILNNFRLVKIGTTQAQRKLFFNLKKERDRLERLGFEPEPKLLAESLDVSEKDVIEMQKRMSGGDTSLDAPVRGDEDGTRTRLDMLASPDQGRPDLQAEKSEFHTILRETLETFADTLEGREETIFRARWLTETPLTLQQIGDRYGVSRERARQVEKRMLNRLRGYLEKELGTAVDIDALGVE